MANPSKPVEPFLSETNPPEPKPQDLPYAPKIGDVVVLKSGGPAMTVRALNVPGELASVKVRWFSPIDHTVSEDTFLLSDVMLCVDKCDAKAWAPPVAPSK